MVIVDGNNVTMTRGDTFIAQIEMKDKNGVVYSPMQGDVIRFTLRDPKMNNKKTKYYDSDPLVTKIVPNNTLLLRLDPADTKNLGFGEYVYFVELTYANGVVDTFIAESSFVLTPEGD